MNAQAHPRAAVHLALGAVVTIAVWCGALPRLLEWPPVACHVALMEERRVDPAAMYYTELERLPLRPAWVEKSLILWPGRTSRHSTISTMGGPCHRAGVGGQRSPEGAAQTPPSERRAGCP